MAYTYKIREHIDSDNAGEFEKDIMDVFNTNGDLIIDAIDLKYISSAGLRVLLRLIKLQKTRLVIENVSSDVYEIFETTGFTEMMDVKKAFRNISVENCPIIGKGGNGTVYRLSDEQIVKVYREDIPFNKLSEEKDFAKKSFVKGVPTAIAFDIVKVGNCYGTVYELMDSDTLGHAFVNHPEKFDEYLDKYVELVRNLASTDVSDINFDTVKYSIAKQITKLEKYMPADDYAMITDIVNSIADGKCFVHGDLHPGNIMLQKNGELMLIDMADVKMGPHTYDILSIYRDLYQASSDTNEQVRDTVLRSVGMPCDLALKVWDSFVKKYLGTEDPEAIAKFTGMLGLLSCISTIDGVTHTDEQMLQVIMPPVKEKLIDGVIKPNYQTLKYLVSTMK